VTEVLCRALERLGATVVVDSMGENLVRATGGRSNISVEPPRAHTGPPLVEVVVQGLPNLLHEFGHILLAECLDDDHGIDYQQIPFDLGQGRGRATLFDELCCCALSCSYMAHRWNDAQIDEWFHEQVEIQPVFYGLEHDVPAFLRAVTRAVLEHADELEAMLARVYRRAEIVFAWAGADDELSRPRKRLSVAELLARR
jgi:hypothetical protein